MQVILNCSGPFGPGSDKLENAKALSALMNALIAIDVAYLEHHQAPRLYSSRVVYKRTNEWESIPDVLRRGHGDCKSLAGWLVAERLVIDHVQTKAVFRFNPNSKGIYNFHILVQNPHAPGGWEDPSKVLGMNAAGRNENSYFGGRY